MSGFLTRIDIVGSIARWICISSWVVECLLISQNRIVNSMTAEYVKSDSSCFVIFDSGVALLCLPKNY